MVKDLDKIKQNGRRVLISLLKKNFQPQRTEETLRKIAVKGTPLMKTNINYWAKKISKYMNMKKDKESLDFQRFAKMDYKDLYNEAVGDLKTNRAKKAYKNLKTLSQYNVGSKILDI